MNSSAIKDQLNELLFHLRTNLTRERLIELFGYFCFCILIFAACLGSFFLEKRATPALVKMIEKQPALGVKLTNPELTFFPLQFSARQVAITRPPIPQLLPTTLQNVTVSIAWTDLLLFKAGLEIRAESLSGSPAPATLHARTTSLLNHNLDMVSASFTDLQLSKILRRVPIAGVITGKFSGEVELVGLSKPIQKMSGFTRLALQDVNCNNVIPALKGRTLNINHGQFNTSWKDGRITIDEATIAAKKFSAQLTGDARLKLPVGDSIVDLRGTLQADLKNLYPNLLDPNAIKSLKEKGKVEIRISDKLTKPQIRRL